MSTFDLYSEYYDLLYSEKDYSGEANYILSLIQKFRPAAKTLLDLGCGTGKHASLFRAAGHDVSGVDMSETMLQQARTAHANISFHLGDARNVRLDQTFDVVTSLFHVASYQTSNADFVDYLSTAKAHMAPGGIFIFDFWYGPGVLTDPPVVRAKRLQNEKMRVLRIAEPTLLTRENVVNVHYQILGNQPGSDITTEITEDHRMRYFFEPELRYFLDQNGMKLQDMCDWMSSSPPGAKSWNACIVAALK